MSKDLFNNLVKLGNNNPDLRKNIRSILSTVKRKRAGVPEKAVDLVAEELEKASDTFNILYYPDRYEVLPQSISYDVKVSGDEILLEGVDGKFDARVEVLGWDDRTYQADLRFHIRYGKLEKQFTERDVAPNDIELIGLFRNLITDLE